MAKRGRPPSRRLPSGPDLLHQQAEKVEEQKPSISAPRDDDRDEHATVSPRSQRCIAVHNIRSNRGDFKSGEELPDGLLGIEKLLEVGAVKIVE